MSQPGSLGSHLSGRAHNLESAGAKPQPDLKLTVGVEASGAGVPTDPLGPSSQNPCQHPGIITDILVYVQSHRHELMH